MEYLNKMEETARRVGHDAFEAGREVWLAGLGAVGMIGNTTTTLFQTLVDEGKEFQEREVKRADKAVTTTTDKVKGLVSDTMDYVQGTVQEVTKVAMNRLGMPSRKDVADLSARVDLLTSKVEALSRKGAMNVG